MLEGLVLDMCTVSSKFCTFVGTCNCCCKASCPVLFLFGLRATGIYIDMITGSVVLHILHSFDNLDDIQRCRQNKILTFHLCL